MYYFFKWLAKKWLGNFSKIREYSPISKMYNGYLDLWWDDTGSGVILTVIKLSIYGLASFVMLMEGYNWAIPLFLFCAHMVLVFFALQYREYQEEKTKILNKLKED